MMDFFRKHKIIILSLILGFFLLSVFIGFGSYFFGSQKGDSVAEVNGKKIPYRAYNRLYTVAIDSLQRQNKEVSPEQAEQVKQEVLQNLVQEEVFYQESIKYGIVVSDLELANDIQRYPQFQQNGRFDRMLYFRALAEVLRTTPREFEQSRRRQIAVYKLRDLIASSVMVSNPEVESAAAAAARLTKPADIEKLHNELKQQETMLTFNEWVKGLNRSLRIKINLPEFAQQAR